MAVENKTKLPPTSTDANANRLVRLRELFHESRLDHPAKLQQLLEIAWD